MSKITLDELRKMREEQKKALSGREGKENDVQVIVGMATCGIAAGAKDTLDAFLRELNENNVQNVTVKQTGCMGLCHSEPTVEVIMPDMPDILYGNVDTETAKRIVRKHIMNRTLVNDHVFDKPAPDIVGGKE
jgi:NADP-reducing hydrogenase subunit HndB